ncbi:hypothetical protein ACFWAY_44275 [Rhodococcus sp. NPDC059968]|uniref:hypothetical protein n=1 Tax=Rhodococcus sp. NPDC059968 TaxID=3347017 RepID=UPI0036722CA0
MPIRAASRTWRVDLAIPQIGLYVDLDPARWHANTARDQRKADAVEEHHYVRIRPESLPQLDNVATAVVRDKSFDAHEWALSLQSLLTELGVTWSNLTADQIGAALAEAADRWNQTLRGRPKSSALDAAPQLQDEFLRNESRPGIDLGWLPPSAKDQCWWRCTAAQTNGAPACTREQG